MGAIYHHKKCLFQVQHLHVRCGNRLCHTGDYALNIDYSDREGNFLPGKILVSYKRLVLQKITELRMYKLPKKPEQDI